MEKISKYSWVLVGHKLITPIQEEDIEKLIHESFMPGKMFKLFLCGAVVDKTATLEDMENGLDLIIEKMKEYQDGDYCIISSHIEGDLLFLPIKEEHHD